MLIRQPRSQTKQLFTERSLTVIIFVHLPLLKLRDNQFDEIRKRFVGNGVGQIEAVDVGLLNPLLELIGNLLNGADKKWSQAPNADPVCNFRNCPRLRRVRNCQ